MWQRLTGSKLLFWKGLSEDTIIPCTIAHSETEWGEVRPQPLFRGGRWATTGCWSLVLWDGLWRRAVAVKEVLLYEGQGDGGATWKPAEPCLFPEVNKWSCGETMRGDFQFSEQSDLLTWNETRLTELELEGKFRRHGRGTDYYLYICSDVCGHLPTRIHPTVVPTLWGKYDF